MVALEQLLSEKRQKVDQEILKSFFVGASPVELQSFKDISQRYICDRGKRFRPVVLLLSYGAVGRSREEEALPAAAVIELIHTSSLVFDDVIDGDFRRRGTPSLHVAISTSVALRIAFSIFNYFVVFSSPCPPAGVMSIFYAHAQKRLGSVSVDFLCLGKFDFAEVLVLVNR